MSSKAARQFHEATCIAILFLLLAAAVPAFAGVSVSELGTPDDFQRLGVFTGAALAGSFGHYLKKWVRGEIVGSLYRYLFVDHPRATVSMVFTLLGTVGGMFLAKQVQTLDLSQLLALSITTGYTVDSVTNRGATGDGTPQP
jgi:hypothetical protein